MCGVAAVSAAALTDAAGGAPDERDRLIDVERLRQVLEGATLIRRHGAAEIRVRRHDDDGQRRAGVANPAQQRQARLTGHPNVGHQHVRGFTAQRFQRGLRRFERTRRHAAIAQRALQHPADGGVVVDEPDTQSNGVHAGSPSGNNSVNTVRPDSLSNSMRPPLRETQLLRHRQAEAGAVRAAGDQRIENARAQLFRNARAVVLHLHDGHETVAGRSYADVGERAGAQHDPAAGAQRLHGVAGHVEQRLNHLIAIEGGVGQAGIVVALDVDRGSRLGPQQVIYVLADLVHVDRRLLRHALGARHGIDHGGQAVRLADDDSRVFLQRGALQLALEKLGGAAQAAERVFDLVGELADHQAAAVEARNQIVLARDALPLGGVGQLEEQVSAGDLAFERCDGDVERAGLAGRADRTDGELAVGDTLTAFERAAQNGGQATSVQQKIREGTAARLIEAEGQEVLCGYVGVDGAELGVQDDDARGERVEKIGRLEMRQRRGGVVLSGHGSLR